MTLYNVLFLLFMIVMSIERVHTTFFVPQKGSKGIIFEKWTIYPLIIFHFLIGILCIVERLLSVNRANYYIITAGIILFVASFLLRKWSVKALGEYESCHIAIKPSHKVIQDGPYKYSRNPRYIANMIEVISLTLIANAYVTLIIALLTYIPSTIHRAVREDAIMARELGSDFLAYRKRIRF